MAIQKIAVGCVAICACEIIATHKSSVCLVNMFYYSSLIHEHYAVNKHP